jgi:hypothetical protein
VKVEGEGLFEGFREVILEAAARLQEDGGQGLEAFFLEHVRRF